MDGPQLSTPSLDLLTRLTLQRLSPRDELKLGVRCVLSMLLRRDVPKPVFVVITTDRCSPVVMAMLETLRVIASEKGVPVVHAMTRLELQQACGSRYPVTAACAMAVKDEMGVRLVNGVLRMTAQAYAQWQQRVAAARELPPLDEPPRLTRGVSHDDLLQAVQAMRV